MRTTDTRVFPFTIAAGAMFAIPASGEKFLIRATTGPVSVRWATGYLSDLEAGQGYNVRQGFADLTLSNNGAGSISGTLLIADADFIDNRIAGEVALDGGTTFTSTAKSVATASAELVAANAARTYLLIQNKHASASMWIAFGVAATTANGIKLPPGGVYETGLAVHGGAVYAIGDAANTDVAVVEG